MNLTERLRREAPYLAVLIAVALTVTLGLCQTQSDWWFEDDTPHLVFVRTHTNPLAYYGPTLVSKLSLGHAVTPWFPFSFWIDHTLGGLNPTLFYLHTIFSLTLTALALYLLAARWMNRPHALAATVIWCLLPSTVSIIEFLSTRHYLEGLLFSISALACALSYRDTNQRRYLLGSLVLYLLAATAKEVYVSTTFVMLFCLYAHPRRYGAVAATLATGIAYAAYRIWCLGLVGKNIGGNLLDSYGLFLQRMPYIFTGNAGGYAVFAAVALVLIALLIKRRLSPAPAFFLAANLAVLLLTMYPVTANITHQYTELGTWYRIAFLLNSFLVMAFAWLVWRVDQPKLSALIGLIALISVAFGAARAARTWDKVKADYTADAQFYLQHPDRVLYSDLPAPWFMYGVHRLYQGDREPHYLTWRVDNGTKKEVVLALTADEPPIWRRNEQNQHEIAPGLAALIHANAEAGLTPLDKPPEPKPETETTVED